ncbi:MAG: diacylglycerol kinase [Actinomycetota bacterium]
MTYRVVLWGTGNVGRIALRAVIEHPDLELAGVIVNTPAKVGVDAGELCGIDPVGVLATDDVAAALGSSPDVVCYTAAGDRRPHEAVEDICRALTSGVNVVSTSVVSLLHRNSAEPAVLARLDEACRAGGSSCFTSGNDPGFSTEYLPLVFTGAVERLDFLRVTEVSSYASYDQPEILFEMIGFGKPADYVPPLLMPGVLTRLGGGSIHGIAAGLGVELDEIVEVHERWNTDVDLDVNGAVIPAGTMAALKFELQGIVNGKPLIAVGHCNRMHDDAAPDWPQSSGKAYNITVEGSPTIRAQIDMVGADGDHNTAGLTITAMRVLHAIPTVCQASPGVLGSLDVGLLTGRGTVR